MKLLSLSALSLLSSCAPANDPKGSNEAPTAITTLPASIDDNIAAPPSLPDLPPCPGINPDIRRPSGSNCLGITPDKCGANGVQHHVGQQGTAELRKRIADATKDKSGGDFRWIPLGTPVIEDLRPNRINVRLDADGIITAIDCF